MQLPISTIQSILLVAGAALPAVHASIALGTQAVTGSGTYNVAWTEGTNPCDFDNAAYIGRREDRLCNNNFQLGDQEYYLVGCDSNNANPQRLRRVRDNSLYGNCKSVARKEIACPGSEPNVYKLTLCSP